MMNPQTVYDLVITQNTRMLTHLDQILEKAEAHAKTKKFEADQFLTQRLIADQFPLIKQIQIACDVGKFSASRLSGKEAPKHPDTEKTMAEAHARIRSVIGFLKTFTVDDFKDFSTRKITQNWMEGKYLEAEAFIRGIAIPNMYFHVTTAYAILRANGVELGKADYLGADLPWKDL